MVAPWPHLKWHALKYSPPRLRSVGKCFNGGVRLSTGSHSSRMHRQDARAQNYRGVHHSVTPIRAQSHRSHTDQNKDSCLNANARNPRSALSVGSGLCLRQCGESELRGASRLRWSPKAVWVLRAQHANTTLHVALEKCALNISKICPSRRSNGVKLYGA